MARTHNWGFVGAGWMARSMAENLAGVPGCRVHSVVACTAESAQVFGCEFGAQPYATLEDLLDDEGLDIVYVNSPNHVHYTQVRQALLAGKPMLCEKPFTWIPALTAARQHWEPEAMSVT